MNTTTGLCPSGFFCFPGTDIVDPVVRDAIEEAMYCAMEDAPICIKLCINGDLVGIGVRIAFYLQAFTNALLVIISPDDSAQGLWSATILTAALVIPAMISKFNNNLTLYHAHMVMNFATLSTVTSLAVAPACTVWRGGAHNKETVDQLPHQLEAHRRRRAIRKATRRRKKERTRERMILSIALLLQIVLQWSWTITLFAHPFYSQPECSGSTYLLLWGFAFRGEDLNKGNVWRWSLWLLFSLFVTSGWGIHMVISSSDASRDPEPQSAPPPRMHRDAAQGVRGWVSFTTGWSRRESILSSWLVNAFTPPADERSWRRVYYRISNTVAFFVVAMYLIVSELQMKLNTVFQGENDLLGFSQVAALLLAITPGWTLAVVLFRRRAEAKDRSRQARSESTEIELSSIRSFDPYDRSGSSPDFNPYQQQDVALDDRSTRFLLVPQQHRGALGRIADENSSATSSSRSSSPRYGSLSGSDTGPGSKGFRTSPHPPDHQQLIPENDSFGC